MTPLDRLPGDEPEVACPKCHSLLVLPDGTCAECGAGVPASLKHEPTLIVPDSIEPVSGWRAWKLRVTPEDVHTDPASGDSLVHRLLEAERMKTERKQPMLLKSVSHSTVWHPRQEVVATCSKGDHDVPRESCTCGLYAARTLAHLMTMTYPKYNADTGQFTVIGEVAMWGGLVEGTQGWRGERAYPTALYLPFEAWQYGAELADTYGVPVKLKRWLGTGLKRVK